MIKSTTISVYSAHPTAEEAVKELEKSGFDMKELSAQPILHPASPCTGKSARELLHLRTGELAVLAGRCSLDITQRDYDQAKREMTGASIPGRRNALLEAAN